VFTLDDGSLACASCGARLEENVEPSETGVRQIKHRDGCEQFHQRIDSEAAAAHVRGLSDEVAAALNALLQAARASDGTRMVTTAEVCEHDPTGMPQRAMRKALKYAHETGFTSMSHHRGDGWWPWLKTWDVRSELKQRMDTASTSTAPNS
jgi:hypothetical protein